jgi:hypothetical protein
MTDASIRSSTVTKLRLLFIVIIVLFGISASPFLTRQPPCCVRVLARCGALTARRRVCAVNLGAAVGFLLDARERRAFVAHLQTEEVGFRFGKDDSCWLWRFSLAPLKGDIDSPTGTAVAITALLGLPFARLRTAIPDEVRARSGSFFCWLFCCGWHAHLTRPVKPQLVAWDLATAMGRKTVFSKTGLDAALVEHREVVPKLFSVCRSAPEADDAEKASAEEALPASNEDERLEEFVGTTAPRVS